MPNWSSRPSIIEASSLNKTLISLVLFPQHPIYCNTDGKNDSRGNGNQDVCVDEKTRGNHNARTAAFASLGAAVGACALLHPLDLVKTRMQVASIAPGVLPIHRTTMAAFKQIFGVEGVRGLYKGLMATMVASGMSWGVFRYLFDATRYAITPSTASGVISSSDVKFRANLAAGITAGLFSTCLVHPFWLVKTRLEMQAHETRAAGWFQYKGWRHCVRSIYLADGVKGFYIGLGPAIGLVPHAALQILLYEEIKKWDLRRSEEKRLQELEQKTKELNCKIERIVPSAMHPFMWGALSKFIAVCTTYPLQVLRARQQMIASPVARQNFISAAYDMILKEGPISMYRGFGAHVQRSCVYNGIMFFIFERLMAIRSSKDDNE